MLAWLIEFSLRQRMLVMLGALALAGAGVFAFLNLPIDAYPDISPTQVKLILKAPGMTPEEVETRVIAPLEMELLGVPKGAMLRSVAKYAIADITLDFAEGTEIFWARQQVAERFAGVAADLPAGVSGGLAPISTPLSDIYMFTIEGGGLSLEERRSLLDWTLRPALRTLPGVADVNVLGGEAKSFVVIPDRSLLIANGLHQRDLVDAICLHGRSFRDVLMTHRWAADGKNAKRLTEAIRNRAEIPAVDYLFNELEARLPDLGGVEVDWAQVEEMLASLQSCLDEHGDIRACMHRLLPSFREPEEINGSRGALPKDSPTCGGATLGA